MTTDPTRRLFLGVALTFGLLMFCAAVAQKLGPPTMHRWSLYARQKQEGEALLRTSVCQNHAERHRTGMDLKCEAAEMAVLRWPLAVAAFETYIEQFSPIDRESGNLIAIGVNWSRLIGVSVLTGVCGAALIAVYLLSSATVQTVRQFGRRHDLPGAPTPSHLAPSAFPLALSGVGTAFREITLGAPDPMISNSSGLRHRRTIDGVI